MGLYLGPVRGVRAGVRRGAALEGPRQAYRHDVARLVGSITTPGSRILEIGCGRGDLLASLEPSFGVGVTASQREAAEARARHPELRFLCASPEGLPLSGTFDFIVVTNAVGSVADVETFLETLHPLAGASTRIVVVYWNQLWEPVLEAASALGLRHDQPGQNWLSRTDLTNLADLADFDVVASGWRTPLPLSDGPAGRALNTAVAQVPVVRKAGITSYLVLASRRPGGDGRAAQPSCTVVVPTRNERGNVRAAVERLPSLGSHTELIFVDGGSTDGTAQEIEVVMADHPEVDIRLIDQGDGRGKGDAVHRGFDAAKGDVLMILDADLTVPPEDLPRFWSALVEGKGELINGTRLVYPMERQAMRLANMVGNKAFGLVFSWILQQRVTDTLCGTKVLWAEDWRRIVANRSLFGGFDPFGDFDLLFGAARLGLRIREVPVRYRERQYGSTNIRRWRHGVLLARMALIGARRFRWA